MDWKPRQRLWLTSHLCTRDAPTGSLSHIPRHPHSHIHVCSPSIAHPSSPTRSHELTCCPTQAQGLRELPRPPPQLCSHGVSGLNASWSPGMPCPVMPLATVTLLSASLLPPLHIPAGILFPPLPFFYFLSHPHPETHRPKCALAHARRLCLLISSFVLDLPLSLSLSLLVPLISPGVYICLFP